jgi:uncharacterized protein YxeA
MKCKIKILYTLIIGLLSIVPSNNSFAYKEQPDEELVIFHKFDHEQWAQITRELDYDAGLPELEIKKANPGFSLNFGPLLQIIVYTIIIAVLVIAIIKIAGKNFFLPNTHFSRQTNEENEQEEDIQNIDLEKLFHQAIQNQDYKLAIRLHYLFIIQKLASIELINWKKDKTNWEYLKEIKNTAYYQPFKQLTSTFENIWYGNKEINKDTFEQEITRFQSFKTSLKQ